ncbi:MAG: hypothetical protein ACI9K2_001687 [Myxococcota bacterium]
MKHLCIPSMRSDVRARAGHVLVMNTLLLTVLLACGPEPDARTTDSAADTLTPDGCPIGSLLRVDWSDHDPTQDFLSGTRSVVTPGVARVRGDISDGSSVELRLDRDGQLVERASTTAAGVRIVDLYEWERGLLRSLVQVRGERSLEHTYAYDGDRVVQKLDDTNIPLLKFSWNDQDCLVGIGSDIGDRGDPAVVRRQTCDSSERVDAYREGLGAAAWGGLWEPGLGAVHLLRDGIDGRPTVATSDGLPYYSLSWWPAGQLKGRDDVRCGTGFGDVHSYDADGTLTSPRTQPCPDPDTLEIPPATETTWTVESCVFD